MSKIKGKETPAGKTQQLTSKEKRKKFFIKHNRKKQTSQKTLNKKNLENPGAKQTAPPQDPQQFSSNWKALQEILKSSQPEKKQPVTPKHRNGVFPKKFKGNEPKKFQNKSPAPSQVHTDREGKVKSGDAPKEDGVKAKIHAALDKLQPGGARKRQNEKTDNEKPAKKKKPVTEERKPTEEDLWFDDVDPDDIEETMGAEAAEIMRRKQGMKTSKNVDSVLVKENAFDGITKAVAIDCEMVGVGPDGEDSILARVSIVNQFGKCIYDKYVKPTEKVTDYRTAVSGIRPEHIKNGEDVHVVQKEVAEILQGRIVVGHAIHNDLKILLLDHPKKHIRDTQKYKPFRKTVGSGRPSLKLLCREILHVKVQQGEHSSVQDAQATMRLYTLVKKQWEAELKASKKNSDSNKKNERRPRKKQNQ
ncbi:RNA exonuclease 4 [Oryzias latipes]|uniref:RNA exonuclease 4 n=1 Tax=Oryzias latipes TaxID=8090 RepID=H2LRH4_ORYLA|nr:RNA exonuclease 4 [Oryzias latipes]